MHIPYLCMSVCICMCLYMYICTELGSTASTFRIKNLSTNKMYQLLHLHVKWFKLAFSKIIAKSWLSQKENTGSNLDFLDKYSYRHQTIVLDQFP